MVGRAGGETEEEGAQPAGGRGSWGSPAWAEVWGQEKRASGGKLAGPGKLVLGQVLRVQVAAWGCVATERHLRSLGECLCSITPVVGVQRTRFTHTLTHSRHFQHTWFGSVSTH